VSASTPATPPTDAEPDGEGPPAMPQQAGARATATNTNAPATPPVEAEPDGEEPPTMPQQAGERAAATNTSALATDAMQRGTTQPERTGAAQREWAGVAESQRAGAAEPRRADRPWRRAVLSGFGIFAASKVGLALVSVVAWVGEKRSNVTAGYIAAQWAAHWDSVWFRDVAKLGYYADPYNAPAAFFPLYPALIRLFTPLCFGKDWVAALLVANLATLGALIVLFRLTEHEFDKSTAGRTVFYLVAFPTGFFLTAAYNEGLFIGLMVASVYCLRKQYWWCAGAFGGLAAFTRSAGILLAGAFVYEYVRVNRLTLRRDVLAILLIPLGVAGVSAVSLYYYHQPLAFLKAQRYWGRHLDWPWTAVLRGFKSLVTRHGLRFGFGDLWVHNLLELATVLLVVAMLVLTFIGPWKLRRDQWILPIIGIALTLLMISFPSSHQPYPLYSASRLGIEVFPAFMLLGRLGARPVVDRTLLALFLMPQGILVAYFVQGGWVA
jgi:hypothetical protein